MMRTFLRYSAAIGLAALGACNLDVQNPNQPETERTLASPNDVESLLQNYYGRWHIAIYGNSLANVRGMANVQSFENYSSLSNNCQGQRVGIPRPANDNGIGNGCGPEQLRVFQIESEVNRVATSVLAQWEKPGYTLGDIPRDLRAKAFAEFLRGLSLGYLALTHDSAAVVSVQMSPEDPGELRGYVEVMDSANAALARAIAYANDPLAAPSFPITWIPTPTVMTPVEFTRLIRSYRARFRANLARTPTERQAADWAAIIADAQNGITADHMNTTSSTAGPFNDWVSQWLSYGTWHQMPPYIIGMADNSGSYAAWIAQPVDQRGTTGAFFMTTPDLRFPQGSTRAAQQADFSLTQCNTAGATCPRYFVNRPNGSDVTAAQGWGASNYDFARYYPWRTAGSAAGQTARNGPFPFFLLRELQMIEAEGQIRTNNFAAAAALVNTSRAVWGLPPVGVTDNTTPIAGGADCVPKVPQPPTFNTIACGNLMEAMKWEKRMETAYGHFMAWFLDSRGWGDLAEGTPLHWAVPYQDLQARNRPASAIYSTGLGTTGGAAAVKGTYGF
jgi:hypothetical protein